MKTKILYTLTLLTCVLIITYSYFVFSGKIEQSQKNATEIKSIVPKKESIVKKDSLLSKEYITKLSKNTDESVQNLLLKRYEQKQNVNVLILGSKVTDGSSSYEKDLLTESQKTYGDFIKFTTLFFNTTSTGFSNMMDTEIQWDKKYDIIVFEPFVLNDQGIVDLTEEQNVILKLANISKEKVNDRILILQPSFPNPESPYYRGNVELLKNFSTEKNYVFFDHWDKWEPSKVYINEKGYLNEDGLSIWTEAIKNYFIYDKN